MSIKIKINEDSIKKLFIMTGDRAVHNMKLYNRWQAELAKARHRIIDLEAEVIEAHRINLKLIKEVASYKADHDELGEALTECETTLLELKGDKK